MSIDQSHAALCRSLRHHLIIGTASTVLLLGGAVAWATSTSLSGAVIAPGILVIEGNSKTVQHPTGGVVAELFVREGGIVRAGQALMRLDSTIAQANLATVTKSLNALYARAQRLMAEQGSLSFVPTSPELLMRLPGPDADGAMRAERRLFDDRRGSRLGQANQLQERIVQLDEQIVGHRSQLSAKDDEISLVGKELAAVESLFTKGLTPLDRVNNLARAAARLRGERGQLVAGIADARGKIAEIQVQTLQINQSLRTEVAAELRDVENKLAELAEKEIAAKDQLNRIDVVAPVSGVVHKLAVHTVGGVVKPAADLMEIVPQDGELTVDARVGPQDIDQISVGQASYFRLSAFNRATTPEFVGFITRTSADLEIDDKSGTKFYRVSIKIPRYEISQISGLKLIPGMPVESFIKTGDRTVISYLAKPFFDHAHRVFREE